MKNDKGMGSAIEQRKASDSFCQTYANKALKKGKLILKKAEK